MMPFYFLSEIKYANFFFQILVLTALTVGLIWTILELTPKSALLWFFASAGSICEAMKQSNPWTNKQMISHQTRSGVDASLCFALENLFAQPAVFCTVRKMEMKLLCYVCARIRIATLNPTTPLINHWWNNWHDIKKVSKGQLISKCLFGVIVWAKISTKKFDKFCPRILNGVKS